MFFKKAYAHVGEAWDEELEKRWKRNRGGGGGVGEGQERGRVRNKGHMGFKCSASFSLSLAQMMGLSVDFKST